MRVIRIALPLTFAVLAACQGGTSEQKETGPIAAEQFAATYADAVCQQAARCQALAPFLVDQCRERRLQLLTDQDLAKGMAAGRLAYDGAQARTCVNGVLATECTAANFSDDTIAACLGAVQGKVANGQPCSNYFECASGFCGGTQDTCPATCAAAPQEGEDCNPHFGPACDARKGLRCINFLCAKPGAEGASCVDNNGCQSGLICVPPTADSIDGVCTKLHKAGEACSGDEACESGLYCRDTTDGGKCEARAAEGKPCGQNIETIQAALRGTQCQDGLVCKGAGLTNYGDPISGYCTKPVGQGQSCFADENTNIQFIYSGCQQGLVCPGGLCALPPTHGLCTQHYECQTGVAYCDDDGQCQRLRDNGEACDRPYECKSGYCSDADAVCADEVNFCHE